MVADPDAAYFLEAVTASENLAAFHSKGERQRIEAQDTSLFVVNARRYNGY